MGPTLSIPFSYDERIEGAIVATYEGELSIVSRSGEWDDTDWVIDAIRLDGSVEAAKGADRLFESVEVELPQHNPLFTRIVLDQCQGRRKHRIDERWNVACQRSYQMASL